MQHLACPASKKQEDGDHCTFFYFANRGLPFLKSAFLSFIAVWGFSSKRNSGGGSKKDLINETKTSWVSGDAVWREFARKKRSSSSSPPPFRFLRSFGNKSRIYLLLLSFPPFPLPSPPTSQKESIAGEEEEEACQGREEKRREVFPPPATLLHRTVLYSISLQSLQRKQIRRKTRDFSSYSRTCGKYDWFLLRLFAQNVTFNYWKEVWKRQQQSFWKVNRNADKIATTSCFFAKTSEFFYYCILYIWMPIGYTSANCKKSQLKAFLEANEFGKPGDVTKLRKRRKRRAGSDRSASSDQRRRRNFRRIKEGENECEQKELSPPPFLLFNSRQEGGG